MATDAEDMSRTEYDSFATSEQHVAPIINRTIAKPAKSAKPQATATKSSRKPIDKPQSKTHRQALKDRTNVNEERVHEQDQESDAATRKKQKKSRVVKEEPQPTKKRSRPHKPEAILDDDSIAVIEPVKPAPKRRKKSVEPQREIPETQDPVDVAESTESIPSPHVEYKKSRVPERARSTSVQRQEARSTLSQQRQRERSVSDTTRRLGDTESRRKLADLTSDYQDLKFRFEELQILGIVTAESNFEKFQQATGKKAKNAAELISALQKELSESRKSTASTSTESARQQSAIAALKAENEKHQSTLKALQSSLLESQNEIKALTAKLENARKSAAMVDTAKHTAVQSKEGNSRTHKGAAVDSAHNAHLKEELYRDLTGLLINSVKVKDNENAFNCVQTGKNGTLNFHLKFITPDSNAPPRTPPPGSDTSYNGPIFVYEPCLDHKRDGQLMDILPSFLTEEIEFPPQMASKFNSKMWRSLNEPIEIVEDDAAE